MSVAMLIPRRRQVNQQRNDAILDIQDLNMYFPVTKGLLRRRIGDIKAVDGVTFQVKRGETLGLLGESGCGKTTVGRCVPRLYKPTGGKITFEGQDISSYPEKKLRGIRSKMALIFQDPYNSLDPR
jgi:peptide/nickel transport system ATP-binding protein